MATQLARIALLKIGSLIVGLFIVSVLTVPNALASGDLRCGNRIVHSGDTRDVVRNRCGAPADISTSLMLRRFSVGGRSRAFYAQEQITQEQITEVPIETWLYNFGPHRFMQRLRFVDGVLEGIESLDYGYTVNE